MRKDVKLGMAIGGGLIVLLIAYLLFTPPATNNKKGTQLASGGGMGNIIDPSGPGDLSASEDKSTAKPVEGGASSNGQVPVTRPTSEVPAKPVETVKAKPETDQWGHTLETGNLTGSEKHAKPKETEHARGGRHETAEGSGAPVPSGAPKLLYNPGDAWGGGLSTDGMAGLSSSGHASKIDLAAGSGAKESADIPAGGGGTHIVKAGETLSSIALAAYGSSTYYPHILRANPNVNPNNLKLGTPLKMPHINDVKADSGAERGSEHSAGQTSAEPEVKIDPSKQYRVQAGDSLYKIALKVYGKTSYVDKIYEKNKALIGADNKRLKLGMILELPEKGATAAAAPNDSTTSSLTDRSTSDENQEK